MSARGRYAVLGDPIEHSLSPRIFKWLGQHYQLALDYSARLTTADHLGVSFAEARAGAFAGFSLTLPLKEVALPLLDQVEDTAKAVGAVNCVRRLASGALEGHNTDVLGVVRALARAQAQLSGAHVLILGAGGGARAAVHAAAHAGAETIAIANRDLARADRLANAVGLGRAGAVALERGALEPVMARAEVIIQATSVGLGAPEVSPLPAGLSLRSEQTVMDMVYRPLETGLLTQARAAGAKAVDGLWMLVYQALAQLTLWTGKVAHDDVAEALHTHLEESIS